MANDPLIITCAVTGAELSKTDHPDLPVTPDEIALSAAHAVEAGASIIHLHVRDEKGMPTQRKDVFASVTRKIRKACNCIIQYSTGGAAGTPLQDRIAPVSLKPDMATLSMGTVNFGADIFENSENTILSVYKEIRKYECMPELEIFDVGMIDTVNRFLVKGLLAEPFHVNFVMGVPGGIAGEAKRLLMLKDILKPGQTWTVSGIGKCQLNLATHAMALGGHVRVGFEDNIYYRKGELAVSNAQFVERIARIAKELDRNIATVKDTRNILGIQ
ncbi:MAG: 3-keto-5-aminohexanoate cleavage protein [Proteobacteria bacterium]|nr:3-keto-5-aminohexanoate cleavage protein [Pseudomonadota bacterium]